jgi:hypothetical protein
MSDYRRMLEDTIAAKTRAEALLRSLQEVKAAGEHDVSGKDIYKRVTGSSSLDNAITATRRTIESYDRVIDELRRATNLPSSGG